MIQPRNSSIQGLILTNPSNSFLPVNVSQTFDVLVAFSASGNKLASVSKENFSGLARLRLLDLSKNKIKRIQNNTFEDLLSLEVLNLSE
jgi:Leucine-rich repeat (LRR) protein